MSGFVERVAAQLRASLPVRTSRCLLREVRVGDVAAVQRYRGLEEVARYLSHPPLAAGEAGELVAGWVGDPAAVTVVAELPGAGPGAGTVIGDVRLTLRPASAMRPATTTEVEAWIGYAFDPQVQGRGLARECVGELVGMALGGLGGGSGVRLVRARVFAPAVASSRLLAALGFHLDGVDRAAVLAPDGRTWWDDQLWSLLPEDPASDELRRAWRSRQSRSAAPSLERW